MDTLGSLIDKLTIVNLKIWMFEDVKRDSKNDHIVADATRKTNILNRQRNNLIQQKMSKFTSGLERGIILSIV